MENILTRDQRRRNGSLGKDEDPGELKFRQLCKLTNRNVYRQGWRGKDEDHPGRRLFEAVSMVEMHAPDFRTDNSFVEVQFINTADHIKIKDSKFSILTKWWNNCDINPYGEQMPLNWFFYHKRWDKIAMVDHAFIASHCTGPKVKLFPGNKQDEWKRGWKLDIDLFSWLTVEEFVGKVSTK